MNKKEHFFSEEEEEILQAGRDLIANFIHEWALYKKYPLSTPYPNELERSFWMWQEQFTRENQSWYNTFKPDKNADQSQAVKKKLREMGWSPCVSGWDLVTCRLDYSEPFIHVLEVDKDELMAIFKACVKAAEWIRDQKKVETKQ